MMVMLSPSSATLSTTPSLLTSGKSNLCFFVLPSSSVMVTSARYLAFAFGVMWNAPLPSCIGVHSSSFASFSNIVIFSSPKSPSLPRSSKATLLSIPSTRCPLSGKNSSVASGNSALFHSPRSLYPLRRSSMFLKSQLSAFTLSNTGNTRVKTASLPQLSM